MKKKIEEITDIINQIKERYTDENFEKMNIKVGKVLTFGTNEDPTVLEITKIKDGRYWAEHIQLHDPTVVSSHLRHNVDATGEVPYCTDCEVPVSYPATKAGRAKYELRKERHLSDGTPIDADPDEDQNEELV